MTQVDPVLGTRRQLPRPNRLVSWLADVDTEPASTFSLAPRSAASTPQALEGVDAESVAPPTDEVRREIRRLELEALKAELEGRAADARLAALDAGKGPGAPAGPGPAAESQGTDPQATDPSADEPSGAEDTRPG